MSKRYKLGKRDFMDGVCFILEELFLLGFEDRDTAISLLKNSLFDYRDEIFETMKGNNPDIFQSQILPELKEEDLITFN